ncbi:Pentatricopeptide repeat-containing protein [Sesamum alatum]|uniref:Pentatricopeptide repeat-containing protein n=1 Tax=Sesamum alatum TaxID=300844 RepID=A0AAE1YH15_9LAMI|nr:Pentatricopeptide repeat-containing protein [Sesamum alatum]
MFRLYPTCKSGPFLKLRLSPSCYLLHSHSVSCISNLSNGTYERNREIDFELLFNACTTLGAAKRLHALLIVSGKAQSIFVATRLVNIYSHLRDVSSSRETFNQVPRKDAYTWNSMVSAYVRNRRFSEAVKCAYEMLLSADARPDFHTFPPVLKACNSLLDGTRLHCWILKLGLEWDVFVAASLIHAIDTLRYYRHFMSDPGRRYHQVGGVTQDTEKRLPAVFLSQDTEKEKIEKAKAIGVGDGKESKLCFHAVKNQENFKDGQTGK